MNLSSASLPVFIQFLGNLRHLLAKAQADVAARGYDEQALVQYRLAPDMLPFKTQICIACDAAKLCVARISGLARPNTRTRKTRWPNWCSASRTRWPG